MWALTLFKILLGKKGGESSALKKYFESLGAQISNDASQLSSGAFPLAKQWFWVSFHISLQDCLEILWFQCCEWWSVHLTLAVVFCTQKLNFTSTGSPENCSNFLTNLLFNFQLMECVHEPSKLKAKGLKD
jgi:hypothetical protein